MTRPMTETDVKWIKDRVRKLIGSKQCNVQITRCPDQREYGSRNRAEDEIRRHGACALTYDSRFWIEDGLAYSDVTEIGYARKHNEVMVEEGTTFDLHLRTRSDSENLGNAVATCINEGLGWAVTFC